MKSEYSILVVDEHPVIRHGVRDVLEHAQNGAQFYEAADPSEALQLVTEINPDVVILGLVFPNANGLDVIAKMRNISPNTEVLVFTMHTSPQVAHQALKAGALGFVTKSDPLPDLVQAVRAVLEKHEFVSHSTLSDPTRELKTAPLLSTAGESTRKYPRPSDREIEIVKLLAAGATNRQTAESLEISVRTVEAHRTNIMRKMQFNSLAELIRFSVRMGWTKP